MRMEMFIDIVLLYLSLMINFKNRITVFVLMETNFVALALKQIIVFSFEMYIMVRLKKRYCHGNYDTHN